MILRSVWQDEGFSFDQSAQAVSGLCGWKLEGRRRGMDGARTGVLDGGGNLPVPGTRAAPEGFALASGIRSTWYHWQSLSRNSEEKFDPQAWNINLHHLR